MKKLFATIAVVGVIIAGCSSFNKYDVRVEYVKPNEVKETVKVADVIKAMPSVIPEAHARKISRYTCQQFVMPVLPKTPPLPYEELNKVNPNDTDAIDRIQQQHIEDLRSYIITVKKQILDAQQEHLQTCGSF